MRLFGITNQIFNSRTYVLDDGSSAFVIDCGDIEPIRDYLMENKLKPKGVFITHAHFDHIYGLNEMGDLFPEIKVYASEQTAVELKNPKLNYSHYQGDDFSFSGSVFSLKDGDEISLLDSHFLKVMATPGHNAGCLSYIVSPYIFTGDSFIPGVKTITNLRGNRQQAKESEDKIRLLVQKLSLIICPGHFIQ